MSDCVKSNGQKNFLKISVLFGPLRLDNGHVIVLSNWAGY